MIKILYIRQNSKGGTEHYCNALYNMFRDDKECIALPPEDYPTIKSLPFHYYYKRHELRMAISKADIIHVNGYTAMGTLQAIVLAYKMGKKIVYSAHWHPFRFLHFPLYSKIVFYVLFRPLIHRYVETVITINNEDTAFFKKIHPHVKQIPHWFDFNLPTQFAPRKRNMILFIGRLNDPVKGLEYLTHLKEGKYDIHCVGEGIMPTRSDFHQHVNISNKALAELYIQASLVVIPSKYEAFSYVALEALFCGTPVLMSDKVRIADYLSGCSGYEIFHYGNYKEFTEKVETTIGQPVDISTTKDTFSQSHIKKLYSNIYKSCMKK